MEATNNGPVRVRLYSGPRLGDKRQRGHHEAGHC